MQKMNVNPWISMWTQPDRTIREIVNISPRKGIFFLAIIFGMQYLLNTAYTCSLGLYFHTALIIVLALILSPLLGYFWFYLFGTSLFYAGRVLKGNAPFSHVIAALAWSSIPYVLNILMWFGFLALSIFNIFTQKAEGATFYFISGISLLTFVWSLILLIRSLKEVQEFSIAKTIGNYFLGLLFYILILIAIGMMFVLLSRIFATTL